jgi:hypothetical protein
MWTAEEDAHIMHSVMQFGQKWGEISSSLPGRSSNAVRNRFLRCCSTTGPNPDAAAREAAWVDMHPQATMESTQGRAFKAKYNALLNLKPGIDPQEAAAAMLLAGATLAAPPSLLKRGFDELEGTSNSGGEDAIEGDEATTVCSTSSGSRRSSLS